MKLPFKIKRKKFTIVIDCLREVCPITRRVFRNWILKIEDINYKRGENTVIDDINGVKCSSMAHLQFDCQNPTKLYLPGSHKDEDYPYVKLDEVATKWFLGGCATEYPKNEIQKNNVGNGYYKVGNSVYTCKEEATSRIIDNCVYEFNLDVTLTEKDCAILAKWTKHHPVSFGGSFVKIHDRWWFNAERIGWILLAARILSGKYRVKHARLAENFKYFIKHGYPKEIVVMDYMNNWIKNFAK
jgi:hypothetical protein